MEKYKLVYVDDNKVVKGSLNGHVNSGDTDTTIIKLNEYAEAGFKKVYEAEAKGSDKILGSTSETVDVTADTIILDRAELEGVVTDEETPEAGTLGE